MTAFTPADALLTPREVAALFHVNPKTVARWATSGQLPSVCLAGLSEQLRAD